jgi:hypothetical protein
MLLNKKWFLKKYNYYELSFMIYLELPFMRLS